MSMNVGSFEPVLLDATAAATVAVPACWILMVLVFLLRQRDPVDAGASRC